MYKLINLNKKQIVESIEESHITDYEYLIRNSDNSDNEDFQKKYKNYWRLNAARLSQKYCKEYFNNFKNFKKNGWSIKELAKELYDIPTHKNGRKSLQFSFCTKLVHMVDNNLPIYDSMIRDFYFYKEPISGSPFDERIENYVRFYQFLIEEYQRIISNGLIKESLLLFHKRFQPNYFSDVKIIDSLLWAFVSLLKKGGFLNKDIMYF
jgi:hypothetical protein